MSKQTIFDNLIGFPLKKNINMVSFTRPRHNNILWICPPAEIRKDPAQTSCKNHKMFN